MLIHSLLFFGALQGAQPPLQAFASTSADSRLPQDTICQDDVLLRRSEADSWARVAVPQQTWMALLGDIDGDGLFDRPDGIDALAYLPDGMGNAPSVFDFVFSCDRDCFGFKDGDVLRLNRQGGLELVYAEDALEAILLPTGGSLDIDALTFPAPGQLYFSLKDSLSGTVLGDIQDGDVLCWDLAGQFVTVIADEAIIQGQVSYATGSSSAFGDVKALSIHPVTQELLYTIQSPSGSDAAVFGEGQGGRILPNWAEDDWQFQLSTEIDALAFVPAEVAQPIVLSTDVAYLSPNSVFQLRMRHAQAGERLSGAASPHKSIQSSLLGGVGYSVVDLGAQPLHRWPGRSQPALFADNSGTADFQTRTPFLPAGMLSAQIFYQVHGGISGWSSPLLIEVE
ncbi:MAG: hypothetical protein ACPG31_04610 [Planctomycetota bacterium]